MMPEERPVAVEQAPAAIRPLAGRAMSVASRGSVVDQAPALDRAQVAAQVPVAMGQVPVATGQVPVATDRARAVSGEADRPQAALRTAAVNRVVVVLLRS